MRLFIDGASDPTNFGDYSIKQAAANKLDLQIVKKLFIQVKGGVDSLDRDSLGEVPKDMIKKVQKTFDSIKVDWAKHVKNNEQFEANKQKAKDDAKAEKEAEKVALEKRKQSAIVLMDTSIKSTAKTLVAIKESVDATIEKFISPKIIVSKKTGLLVIKKDAVLSEKDFADSFAGFANLNAMQGEFAEKAAEREAQLAMNAAKAFPDTWELWFENRPNDLARIKKGIKVYNTLEQIERPPFNTMANMRKALELKVENNNEPKNLEAKTELVDTIIAFQEKEDRQALQKEISEMRDAVRAKYKGEETYKKPQQVYLIQNPKDGTGMVVAGPKDDQGLLAVQYISFGQDLRMHKLVNGEVVVTDVKEPTTKQLKIIQELIDDLETEDESLDDEDEDDKKKKPVKKAPAKEKEPVEEEEEESDDDSDEESEDEEEDDSDDDSEEDESEEDESEDEEDDESEDDSDEEDDDEDEESDEDSDDEEDDDEE